MCSTAVYGNYHCPAVENVSDKVVSVVFNSNTLTVKIGSGGETSSVIGTILAARKLYSDPTEAQKNLFFVFNNPPEDLLHLDRSRLVLEDPHISKIELCSGPQAVTGSTRMQATTIETFVLGLILEEALKAKMSKVANSWIRGPHDSGTLN